jgi:hypothetical protein
LTFPILPAPSVFCSCQSPTILYLDLLLGAPFEDADGAAEREAWPDKGAVSGGDWTCRALRVFDTEACVSSLIVGSAGRVEGVEVPMAESVCDR